MKAGNNASQAQRFSEVGLVWEEKLLVAGSIEVAKHASVRVRCIATGTVSIDGVVAATMIAAEILIINAGSGDPLDAKETVTITTGSNMAVQVARDEPRKS